MPHISDIDPYMKAVSEHFIEQKIFDQGAEAFTGDAAIFWS